MDPRGERLRRVLHAEAAETVPGEGLPAIRSRIAQRRPWWRRALHTLREWDRAVTAGFGSLALTPTRTNGAPAATGTPPNQAVPMEGATAMAHTLQSETTPRGKQIRAAITLAHLLETDPLTDVPDAPPVEWRIDAAGQIHGHVNDPWNDARARAAMVAVGEFLGVPVAGSQGRNSTSEWVHLTVSATYRGVRVNVWTRVAIRTAHPHGGKA